MNDDSGFMDLIRSARKPVEEVAPLLPKKREFVAISVTKSPPHQRYIRIRDGEEWHYTRNAFLVLPADFGSGRRDCLLIHRNLEKFVESKRQLNSATRILGLAYYVDAHGSPGYWGVNLRDLGTWGSSARRIVDDLKNRWGMICTEQSYYVICGPEDDLGEPVWPEGSCEEWLARAFKGRVIDTEDHPEIKKLLGRK